MFSVRRGAQQGQQAAAYAAAQPAGQPVWPQPARALGAAPQKPQARRDPAPSRVAYRLHRLWLTPLVRKLLRFGMPLAASFLLGAWYLSDGDRIEAISAGIVDIRRSIETRPEFMVKLMAIDGASPSTAQAIRDYFPIEFPVSSFDLDLDLLQAEMAELDVIESVALRIRPGGVLEVSLTERVPAVVWRSRDGVTLLDRNGYRIQQLTSRTDRADLPLIAGQGAQDHVAEALAILSAASPYAARIRGLVRMGQRRWDIVLTRDQRIMLPETDPVSALQQVIALDQAQDLLARDLLTIDMRNPLRPTLRLSAQAQEELRRIKEIELGASFR